jgi:8-oxo-dGTP pyrophosphatase MutT (NUDIX family)
VSHAVSVKGVLVVEGHVVLLRNARTEWELPGGRVEPGEDHVRALAREFLEELALRVSVGQLLDSYLFEVIPARHVRIVTYACQLIGEFAPRVSEEHSGYGLWPVDRLAEISLPHGYRRSVERWARILHEDAPFGVRPAT